MVFSSISPARSSKNIANGCVWGSGANLNFIGNATWARRVDAKSLQAIPENRSTLKLTLHSQCTHQK
jgi:hypothetical protein